MEVMMLIGRYAGEIRDIVPHVAHGLIERGEALDPNVPIVVPEEVPVPAAVAEVTVKVPKFVSAPKRPR